MNVTIGIDPDSRAHGVAIYEKAKLVDLLLLNHPHLFSFLKEKSENKNTVVVCENVLQLSQVFRQRANKKNMAQLGRMGCNVGMNQTAQIIVEQFCEHFEIPLILAAPSSKWKSTESIAEFKKVTGWQGRTNADTRSAAYFGFLYKHLDQIKII